MELRPKIEHYDRDKYDAQRHLHDLIAWAELAEEEISELKKVKSSLGDVSDSMLLGLPENMPLYKDSGLWQMRSDNMEDVIIQQEVNEDDFQFLKRCRGLNPL